MKRFFVAIPTDDSGVELHAMKEWLRQHPEHVPPGLDATSSTSHRLRDGLKGRGWIVQESDLEVRLIRPSDAGKSSEVNAVLGETGDNGEDDEQDAASPPTFGLEYQLRDFLAQNLASIEVDGRRLRLYVDPAGRDGVEYPTGVGPIDILAVDQHDDFVVFELKRARTADRALGQLARYMGWVKHTIGREKEVRGVVVAREIDQRLKFGASIIPGISLYEYTVQFTLQAASLDSAACPAA